MKNKSNNYDDIITQFFLITMLNYVGMPWIIETNQQLEYDIDKHNQYWIKMVPSITHLFVKITWNSG